MHKGDLSKRPILWIDSEVNHKLAVRLAVLKRQPVRCCEQRLHLNSIEVEQMSGLGWKAAGLIATGVFWEIIHFFGGSTRSE